MAHLAAVPDDDGEGGGKVVTEESLSFGGTVSKLAFDRNDCIVVSVTIDPSADVSNLDLAPLRGRPMRVVLEPRTASGAPASATKDPVREAMRMKRALAMSQRWFDPRLEGEVEA
ncbi:MAG: hypothetical protein ACF8PN_08225 [Phycisphaerales bacterium]